MTPQEMEQQLIKTAKLLAMFGQQSEQITQRLDAITREIPYTVQQAAHAEMQRLSSEVIRQVSENIQRPVSLYEQRLQEAGQSTHKAASTLEKQLGKMGWLHQQAIWKVWGVVAFSALVLIGGSLWLAAQYRTDIKQNQIRAELLRAYNQADVNICGGRLCVRVEKVDPKNSPYGEYVLAKPRSSGKQQQEAGRQDN